MTQEEITALAREYAEEIYRGSAEFIDEVEQVICWLTRRYCLVGKERVKDEYHEAKFTCGNVDPCSDTFVSSLAQKSVLERLFPEIAKEVEA